MCGLAGVAGDLQGKDADIAKELLYLSQVRGSDATGLVTYKTMTRKFDTYKRAMPAATFLDLRRVEGMISPQADVLMLHTRRSTGAWDSKYNHEDAHPFHWNNVIGMHNGMIPPGALDQLPHKLKGAIDSEQLIYNISKAGVDGTIPLIWGAWALALLDTENRKLGFVRNRERPFAYAFSKDKKRMYWASEGPMLFWVLNRYGIETSTPYPQILPEDTFLEFDLGSNKPIGDSWTQFKCEGGKEPEKKPTPPTGGNTGNNKGAGKTTSPSRSFTPQEAMLKMIEGMESQLLSFDHSTMLHWPKMKRKRFDGIVRSLSRVYKDWAEGSFVEDMKQLEAPEKMGTTDAGKTHKEVAKQLLADKGCAFCCKDQVEDFELEACGIGSSGEVLCNVCNADSALRSIAQVQSSITH
jgi:hypothetical protein